MLFNSLAYFFFLPAVVLLYFIFPFRYRWLVLLGASYFFYGYWKIEYLGLILFSTFIDYYAGYKLGTQNAKRKRYLYLSVFVNLGVLFVFKYYNFFTSEVLAFSGHDSFSKLLTHQLLLPVGISFYTFQTMSYTIDVYHAKLKYEKNFGIFALYVSFFPQLVAGPIERAGHLLNQFRLKSNITFSNVHFGLLRILWGLFKKVVIADRLAMMVNEVYNDVGSYGASQYLFATFFFAFQIYCDFSGYSDIAIGSSRIFGIRLMENFNRPYLASSIGDFWHRWHISLSTWFRDYLYIPLGGNRAIKWRWYYNLFITFFISGLWHGANWTFMAWGAIHGLLIVLENMIPMNIKSFFHKGVPLVVRSVLVFVIVLISWVFFRANSINDAMHMITNISFGKWALSQDVRGQILYLGQPLWRFVGSVFLIAILMSVDYTIEKRIFTESRFIKANMIFRTSIYIILIFGISVFGVFELNEFIYFQF